MASTLRGWTAIVLFNHRRQRVQDHIHGDESLCPLCASPLIARRGEVVIWHWAHRAVVHGRAACPFEESTWHLAWKAAYLGCPGWKVEYPIEIEGHKYVLDAFNPTTGRVREFVHSLSPYYRAKHLALRQRYADISWLFDGDEFVSLRKYITHDGGSWHKLLKPRALLAADELVPDALVHFGGEILRRWRFDCNIWYPLEGNNVEYMLDRFDQTRQDSALLARVAEIGVHERVANPSVEISQEPNQQQNKELLPMEYAAYSDRFPIVYCTPDARPPGRREWNATVSFYCKYCRVRHRHGLAGRSSQSGQVVGVRSAHCDSPQDERYSEYLLVIGEEQYRPVKRTRVRVSPAASAA
jgi:hypothetical protein